MNREVLFRGKTTDTGEWVYGYLASGKHWLDEDSMTVIIPTDGTFYPHCEISEYDLVDPETVGQYTGLKDKNGNKIFEGDIVKLDDYVKRTFSVTDSEVVYNGGMFKVGNEANLCCSLYTLSDIYFVLRGEVIGNIWDNLEKIMEVEK